jgi:hypothetical protein
MDGIIHTVAEFLKLNRRTAFALFAAGTTLWPLVRWNIITHDAIELSLGYLTAFGFFVWLHFTTESLTAMVGRWLRRREGKRTAEARAAAAKVQAEADRVEAIERAEATRRTAVASLGHLNGPELETVGWMHHRQQFRIRANQSWVEIGTLVQLNVLLIENRDQLLHDRFFVMPQHIRDALQALFGPPREAAVANTPPWTTRSRSL